MSRDRTITFLEYDHKLEPPTTNQIFQICKDYLGTDDVKFEKEDYITCGLPGKPNHPLKCIWPDFCMTQAYEEDENRWFEVMVLEKFENEQCKKVVFLTRLQDKFTNIVVDGLVDFLASNFGADVER
jgi:hypothetical protein